MKYILSLLFVFLWITGVAQETCSRIIDRATPVDTARYKVTYSLKYKFHPDQRDAYNDTRIVQIGKRNVKDYSDIINHFDSLATEQVRRGADSYSNVSGNPWPLEIIRPIRGKKADLKYRLSISAFFVYSDSIPSLEWNFSGEETDSIMGYDCRKATAEFAGRTYTAWFTPDVPLPFGPYKFGGLPGLILKIEDAEKQFIWEAIGFERTNNLIMEYTYRDGNDKRCSATDVEKTLVRYFKSPVGFMISEMGGDSNRVHIVGKDGKVMNNADATQMSVPYKPLEIK
ncbi:GLPGLI family protein [Muribaculum intestinale]|uniref:GLPGLI family protein n=1 Tax=Muribaculum intestinale TaxID=1796646 RepID=UPI0025A96454|nr:GLPGLI family protein [Muribaculum intestinale]